ncbi:hypothetical protein [Amycolatopsis sp. CA-230715]|uniref:hypothetical protein n=1 Tax=Amycolatopsis sp. CA-230715 TaxID=2745196 RepID=UPI001C00E744|nr:hypothetical protein [Amycolatopsis sp. CA-230715]QWF85909.1 hypothetical protein HUW46_09389 [Amycolatopsis sp. CA-230715]
MDRNTTLAASDGNDAERIKHEIEHGRHDVKGWTRYGAAMDGFNIAQLTVAGVEFTVIQGDRGETLVLTDEQWRDFRTAVIAGQFDDETRLHEHLEEPEGRCGNDLE